MRNAWLFFDDAARASNNERSDWTRLRETVHCIIPVVVLLMTAMFLHAGPNQALVSSYGKLPLAFEENRGQAPAGVSYLSRTRSGVVFLRSGSVALESGDGKTVTMRFVGATARTAPAGEEKLPGITSYMVGDKGDWVRGVPNYASVRYTSIYPGIDAVFYGNQKDLEYDFVISRGADPDRIRIAFEGVGHVVIDAHGDLVLTAPHGTMKQRKPKIWQAGPHGRREVAGRYVLSGAAEARFELDAYDRDETLVIDPVIEYSTYFGSNRDDRVQAIATDSTGAAYVAGSTATGGVSWGFVSKLNPAGTVVVYTVFFGNNTCNAAARGIGVDSGNNAIVTGYYTQLDLNGFCTVKQVFGAKLNPVGDAFVYQLVWGGGQDYGNAVAVDAAGNSYFTGSTNGGFPTSANVIFPTGGAAGDAFITKLSPTGVPVYSTYLGGGLMDEGLAIAVDANGNAYVAGSTGSGNFPTTPNAVQAIMPNSTAAAFVTELNSTATQILYSTFLGGNSRESAYGVAVDGLGKIHLAGNTRSNNFPTSTNAWDRTCGTDGACNPYYDGAWHNAEDAFYSKVDPLKAGLLGLTYSTFIGGMNRDFGEAIAIDKNGRAWIAGRTASTGDFPTVRPTQGTSGGDYDAFIAQIDPSQSGAASLLFSTFLGGSLYDEATAVKVSPLSHVYIAGYTGSANFPVVGAIQPVTAGGNEGFVVKLAAPALGNVTLNPATVTGGASSTGTVTLTAAAPAGGAVVTLTSSNTNAATLPATVTVAAGATTATFTVTTKIVTTGTVVTITAAYSGVSKTASLVVNSHLASITLNPVVLTGGAGSTGTVTLTAAAPTGGAMVTLASNNVNVVTIPASVTVAAGATSATFAVTTVPVTVVTAVNITASYNGASKIVTLVVNPPLTSVSVNPVTVTGGAASTGTVTLATAAPTGGAVVTLTSSNINVATVPPSVTVPGGATNATFGITTKAVTTVTPVTITATYSGTSRTVTLVVNPPSGLASVALNPTTVIGGAGSTGTVTLATAAPAGGALITLTSNNINAATVPASVTVTAGATAATFAVASKAVTMVTAVTITATYNGVTRTATLTVNPPAAVLAALALNPATVTGGAGSTGTVTLSAAAPAGGALITLTSNKINAATVPASVTVAAGATTATFAVTSKAVTTVTAVTITATYNGVTKTATLTVNPPAAALAALALNPATVTGGAGSTGTVTLSAAAPAGGALITLTSNKINAATVPATVTVAAGATTATFAITSKAVTTVTAVTITATYNGVTKTAALTVNPPVAALQSLSLNPAVMIFGGNATGTVRLTSAAPAGGAVIALASTDWIDFYLPASVTVPAGARSVQFTVSSVLTASTTTITATYNGVAKTANLTSVKPTVVALTCNPNPVIAGTTTVCTVTLNGIMVEPTPVFILSDQPFFAPASGTVTVPAGASGTAFSINTTLVPDKIVAHISANALARAAVTTQLTIDLTNRGKKWVLNNVVFKNGGTASGYFIYDAATGQYLAVNIQVTPGADPNNPLGKSPVNLYYYPWPNGFFPTILDDWSTANLLSLQDPAGFDRPAWTLFQLNFAQALTNAGGTIPLVIDPVVAYSTYCVDNIPAICTPPPANISQELFAMPPWPGYVTSAFYFRVIVSGTVTAQ